MLPSPIPKRMGLKIKRATSKWLSFYLARPERFELPTFWFVARHSIQLSYGRSNRRSEDRCRFHASSASRCPDTPLGFGSKPLTWWVRTQQSRSSHRYPCGASLERWRRGRDSNPRRAFNPYSLSRGALSTTQPSLRFVFLIVPTEALLRLTTLVMAPSQYLSSY